MKRDEALEAIDADALTRLAVTLGQINSPTGHEEEVGLFILDWLRKAGIEAFTQEVAQGRRNVIARIPGSRPGAQLLFNTHMDTKFGAPEDVWIAGEMGPEYTSAWLEGEKVFGHGLYNAKAILAAFLTVAKALRDTGVPLERDLLLVFVVGEIGTAPIDEFQGPRYYGKGSGSRHAVDHGVLADFALVGEPTHHHIVTAQAGAAYFKLTVEGRQVYTPFLPIPKTLSEHPSAIVKMARVVEALEAWGRRYSEANTLELGEGGERLVPKVSMGAIRGGLPYKIGTSVGRCSLYLDVRLPPGKTPAEVERELHGVIRGLGLEARVENYLFRQGYRASGAEPLIAALRRAHAEVHGAPPSPPPPPLTSMWQDMNVFNQVGIPSVSYGPFVMRTVETGVPRDYVVVEDLHRVAQVYALTALSLCGGKEVMA